MMIFFVGLCLLLLFLSIACRALHEYIRHDLERLCTRQNCPEYFNAVIDHYESVRLGFEMIRSLLLFLLPILALYAIFFPNGIPSGADAPADSLVKNLSNPFLFLQILPYFVAFIACRYWIARPLGDLYATSIVYHFFHFFRFVAFFALPLSWLARFVEIVIQRLAGVSKSGQTDVEDLEEDLRSMVAEGHRDGIIEDDLRAMLERIMQLDDAHVSTIMTPRTEMKSISRDVSWEEMIDFVNETQLSRIPVFGEDRDDIVGVLFSKDLLMRVSPNGSFRTEDWSKNLRTPVFVPETKLINILLQEFLKTQNHFAIVLDEYGGVSGLVTLEDILEQIVGEIADETDDAPPEEIHFAEDGSAEVLGRVHINEINSQLGTEFSTEGDFETIGGFILTQMGRVPTEGEEIEAAGVKLIVLEATARKIEKVRILLSETDSDAEKSAGA